MHEHYRLADRGLLPVVRNRKSISIPCR